MSFRPLILSHRPCGSVVLQKAWLHHATRSSSIRRDKAPPGIKNAINTSPTTKNHSVGFDTSSLNVYSTTIAPDVSQLKQAGRFFTAHSPNLLFSNAQFRLLPQSHHPEVTFLGRSNVGKSSMLNALFGRSEVAFTSSKPGKTRLMNAYGVSPHPMSAAPQSGTKGAIMTESWRRLRGGCLVVDMPGYGAHSQADWGTEIMKYIEQRRQLRRAFVLVDSEHGLKSTDLTILEHLFRKGIPHTIVLSKIDKLVHPHSNFPSFERLQSGVVEVKKKTEAVRAQLKKDVWGGRDAASDILCVSSERSLDEFGINREKIGINELRWAILCACGLQESKKAALTLDILEA